VRLEPQGSSAQPGAPRLNPPSPPAGDSYPPPSDDDDTYGALPSYASYAGEAPAAEGSASLQRFGASAELSLRAAQRRLRRLLADTAAAVAEDAPPAALTPMLECLGELAAAAAADTPAAAALPPEARLHLATVFHAVAAAIVLPPFTVAADEAASAGDAAAATGEEEAEALAAAEPPAPPQPLAQMARLCLRTLELTAASAPVAAAAAGTAAGHPTHPAGPASGGGAAAEALEAARRSVACLALLATQIEPVPAAASAALKLARERLAAMSAAQVRQEAAGQSAPALAALDALAASAPLQDALARLYGGGRVDDADDIPRQQEAAATSSPVVAPVVAQLQPAGVDEDDEAAALAEAVRLIGTPAAPPPPAAAPPTHPQPAAVWLRRLPLAQIRSQVASAIRAAGGASRLAGASTSLLLPLDLRATVLASPAGLPADPTDQLEGEDGDGAAAALDLCASIARLELLLTGRAAVVSAGAAGASGVVALPPPRPAAALTEHLRALRALLCTFCLSSNLPSGAANAHALGRLVSRRLSAIGERALLPAALRLVAREAAVAARPHAAANARLCATAALSWALSASVPLSALFDPAGALSAAWPAGAAVGAGAAADEARAAWRALRAAQPQPVDQRAVALLLSCARSLVEAARVPAGPAPPAGLPAADEVPIRLAGGFSLAADAPCSADRRLEALFALPGSTLLDALLGLTLAASLRPADTAWPPHTQEEEEGDADALLALLGGEEPAEPAEPAAAVPLRLLHFLNNELLGPAGPACLAPLLRRSLASRHVRALTLLLQFGPAGAPFEVQPALSELAQRLAPALPDRTQAAMLRSALAPPAAAAPLRLHPQLLRFYARVAALRVSARLGGAADDGLAAEAVAAAVDALSVALASAAAVNPALPPLPLPHAQLLLLLWHSLAPAERRQAVVRLAEAASSAAASGEAARSAAEAAAWRVGTLRLVQMLDYVVAHPAALPPHLPAQLHALLAGETAAAPPAALAFDPRAFRAVCGPAATAGGMLSAPDLYELRAPTASSAPPRRARPAAALPPVLDAATAAALRRLLSLAHASPTATAGRAAAAAHTCQLYHTAWRLLAAAPPDAAAPPGALLSASDVGRAIDAARRVAAEGTAEAAGSSVAWLAAAAGALRHEGAGGAAVVAGAAAVASAHAIALEGCLQGALRASPSAAAALAAASVQALRRATAAAAAALAALALAAASPAGYSAEVEAVLRMGGAAEHPALERLAGGATAARSAVAPGQPTETHRRWAAIADADAPPAGAAETRVLRLLTAHLLADEVERAGGGAGAPPTDSVDEDEDGGSWAAAAARAALARRAAAEEAEAAARASLARLQLTVDALLRASAAAATALAPGAAEAGPLGLELIGLGLDAWLGFCAPAFRAAAAAALPSAAGRAAWADICQLQRLHAAAATGGRGSPAALVLAVEKLETLAGGATAHALLFYRGVGGGAMPPPDLGRPGGLAQLLAAAPAGEAIDSRALEVTLSLLKTDDEGLASGALTSWPLPPREVSLARAATLSLLAMDAGLLEAWLEARSSAASAAAAATATPAASWMAETPAALGAASQAGAPSAGSITRRDAWARVSKLLMRLAIGPTDGSAEHAAAQTALCDRLWPVLQTHLERACCASAEPGNALGASPDTVWAAWGGDVFRLMLAIASRAVAPDATAAAGRLGELVVLALRLLDRAREAADAGTAGTIVPTDEPVPMDTDAPPTVGRPPLAAACALLSFLGDVVAACQAPEAESAGAPQLDPPPSADAEMGEHATGADDGSDAELPAAAQAGSAELGVATSNMDEADADVSPVGDLARAEEQKERQLACSVCSFAVTGSNFTDQHWYYCYTCGLTQSEGCCSVCIRVCHKGHVVSYSRCSRFFCDCGAGGLASRGIRCSALTPRRFAATRHPAPATAAAAPSAAEAGLPTGALASLPAAPLWPPRLSSEARLALLRAMGSASLVRVVFASYQWLRGVAEEAEWRAASQTSATAAEALPDLFPPGAGPKPLMAVTDLAATRAALRPGTFDVKPRPDAQHARDTRTLLSTGALCRQLLGASAEGLLAVIEGERLHICDAPAALALAPPPSGAAAAAAAPGPSGQAHRHHVSSAMRAATSGAAAAAAAAAAHAAASAGGAAAAAAAASIGTPLERTSLRALSKTVLGFEAVSISFCPMTEAASAASEHAALLIAGLRSCIVLGLGGRGEVLTRTPLDIGLDPPSGSGGPPPALLRACWLPLSDGTAGGPSTRRVALLCSQWVKIVDVTRDRPALLRHFAPPDDQLKDVSFVPGLPTPAGRPGAARTEPEDGLVMLVMGSSGAIFSQPLSLPRTAAQAPAAAPVPLSRRLAVPVHLLSRLGATIHYSSPTNLLFTAYADGRAFALRLNAAATEAIAGFALHPVAAPAAGGSAAPPPASAPGAAAAAAAHAAHPSLGSAPPAPSPPTLSSVASWRSVPHSHWHDVPGYPGLLVAACRKTLSPVLLCVTPSSVDVQPLRPSSRAEGLVVAPMAAAADAAAPSPPPCVIWSLHEDGSLACHQPTRPPLGGAAARASALRHALRAAFARRTPGGTRLSFPVDAFERGSCITESAEISLATDAPPPPHAVPSAMRAAVAGAGGGAAGAAGESDRLKARLSAVSEDHLAGSMHGGGGLVITVSNSSSGTVPIGVRVLLGASHPRQVPATIKIFGRTVPTARGERRWYDLPFTPAESVAGLRSFTVTLSAVHSPDRPSIDRPLPPVVNALEVFGSSRADFGLDAVTRALQAKHLPPSRTEAAGGQTGAPLEVLAALEGALGQLRGFHLAAGGAHGVGAAAPEREQMLAALPSALLHRGRMAPLRKPTKALLLLLEPRRPHYHELKDVTTLRHAHGIARLLADRGAVASQAGPAAVGGLPAALPGLCKMLRKRPLSFLCFLRDEPAFLPQLCAAVQAVQPAPLAGGGRHDARHAHLYPSLVQILLACAHHLAVPPSEAGSEATPTVLPSAASLEALRPVVQQLAALLLSPAEAVRAVVLAAASRALLAPVGAAGGAPAVAGAPASSAEAGSPALRSDGGGAETAGALGVAEMLAADDEPLPMLSGYGGEEDVDGMDGDEIEEDEGDEGDGLVVRAEDVMDDDMGEEEEEEEVEMAMAMEVEDGRDAASALGGDEHGGEGEDEEAMLAMALAMSLQQARRDGVAIDGEQPQPAARPPLPPPSAAAAASTRDARRRQRYLIGCVRTLLLDGLPSLAGRPGMVCLPYMQLLLQLSGGGAAEAPPDDAAEGAAWGARVADVLYSQLTPLSSVDLEHRSPEMELQVLRLLLLCLLVHRDKRAAAAAAAAGSADALATGNEAVAAGTMQSALASRLVALGIAPLLHSLAQRLFLHFSQATGGDADEEPPTAAGPTPAPAASSTPADATSHRARPLRPGGLAAAEPSGGGGSLSTARALAPFFSEAYAKAHIDDLFEEAAQLLLDSALRLGQRLAQRGISLGSGASSAAGGSGSWTSLLCRIIHSPALGFARKQAKKLLLVLCGSKARYAEVRDCGLASLELGRVRRIVEALPTGGLSAGGDEPPPPPLRYESQLELSASLQRLHEAAAAQPANWVRFCAGGSDDIPDSGGPATLAFLLRAAFALQADASLHDVLKLIVLGLSEPAAGADRLLRAVPIGWFTRLFVLGAAHAAVRAEAVAVLRGLWAQPADRGLLLKAVAAQLPSLPLHGAASRELLGFVGDMLVAAGPGGGGTPPTETAELVLDSLVAGLREQTALLAGHPNAPAYASLGALLELDGLHLERVPCLAAGRPEARPAMVKLEALRAETKFSDSCQIVQLSACQSVHGGQLRIVDARRSVMVSSIRLYANNQHVGDIGELKNQWSRWTRVRTLSVAAGQAEVRFDLPVPVVATNLLIEYAAFHDNPAGQSEKLQCPRCSRSVADRHGICKHCGDNAYQCRHCRNINYEKLDAFLCNECGFCKHARFHWSFSVEPSFAVQPISTEADRGRLEELIDSELSAANGCLAQLDTHQRAISRLLAAPDDPLAGAPPAAAVAAAAAVPLAGALAGVPPAAAADTLSAALPGGAVALGMKPRLYLAASLYSRDASAAQDALFKSAQTLQAARAELLRYMQPGGGGEASGSSDEPGGDGEPSSGGGALGEGVVAMEVAGEGGGAGGADPSSEPLERAEPPPPPLLPNVRFDSASAFVIEVLTLFERLAAASPALRDALLARGVLDRLLTSCLTNAPRKTQVRAGRLLCLLCHGSAEATGRLNRALAARLELCVTNHALLPHDRLLEAEVGLLCDLCRMDDALWPDRLGLLLRALGRALEHLGSALLCRRLLLPCLRVLVELLGPAPPAGALAHPLPPVDMAAWLRDPPGTHAEWRAAAENGDGAGRQLSRGEAAALRLGRRWRARAAGEPATGASPATNWLCELLLCPPSQPVREAGCALLLRLAAAGGGADGLAIDLLDVLEYTYLPRGVAAGGSVSAELFDALNALLVPEPRRLFLVARGALGRLCSLIGREAALLQEQERADAAAPVDMSQGRVLRALAELLASLLAAPAVRARLRREGQLPTLLSALLAARGLVAQRTCHTEAAAATLERLLTELHEESDAERASFMAACVAAMRKHAGAAAAADAASLAARASGGGPAPLAVHPAAVGGGSAADARALTFLLGQLCGLVCPERAEPDYALQLNKAHTQEEFIRGAMAKNPYTSRAIGPLMRDVKNRICRDLDMLGLIEDDNGMELLVAGSIIKLDLPVAAVYEQVWAQSARAQALAAAGGGGTGAGPRSPPPPMVVVYRLQGLDGEATEPIVETLGEEQGDNLEPEVQYGLSAVVGDEGGLALLLALLGRLGVPRAGARRECAALLLKLLQACCRIAANRQRVLQLGGARLLLRRVPEALGFAATEGMAERLVQTAAVLMEEEARASGAVAGALPSDEATMQVDGGGAADDEWAGFVEQLLDGLELLRRRGAAGGGSEATGGEASAEVGNTADAAAAGGCDPSKGLCRAITRLLPLVARGRPALVRRLYAHFAPYADFGACDSATGSDAATHAFMLGCLAGVLADPTKRDSSAGGGQAVAAAAAAAAIKAEAVSAGLAASGAAYLVRNFPAEKGGASQTQWAAALGRPAVAHVLQLLVPLARGAAETGAHQALLAPEVMLRVHALERQSSSAAKAIGAWAEALLENLREAGQSAKVDELRRSTLASKRKAALDKRQRILQSMGMAQAPAADDGAAAGSGAGKARVVLSRERAALMEDLQEEAGHVCVVCGEGEAYRPGEPLGAYVFTKRVPLLPAEGGGAAASAELADAFAVTSPGLVIGSALGGAAGDWCHTTVTHFNTIHARCHREASAAERSLKAPKEEWEGATLRNSQTRTNGLWPFRGASVSADAYALCVEGFWAQAHAAGRADGPRLRLLAHNLRLLLLRFACEESFSRDSHGGGRESNLRLVPYMVQMAAFTLDHPHGEPSRRSHRRALAAYLEAAEAGGDAAPAASSATEEPVLPSAGSDSLFYQMVLSLFLHSPAEWAAARPLFLRLAVRLGPDAAAAERLPLGGSSAQSAPSPLLGSASRDARSPVASSARSPGGRAGTPSRSPGLRVTRNELPPAMSQPAAAVAGSSSAADGRAAAHFEATRPALIFFALVDRLQSILKEPRPWQPAADSDAASTGGEAAAGAWVAAMRERLRRHDQAVLSELSSLLCSYQEELLPLANFDEALDVLGMLGQALEAGAASATEYVGRLQGWS
jgi:hypothetical protein